MPCPAATRPFRPDVTLVPSFPATAPKDAPVLVPGPVDTSLHWAEVILQEGLFKAPEMGTILDSPRRPNVITGSL